PSPGHSFLTILQPGHAGIGMTLTNESVSSISIRIDSCLISWTAFHKKKSILNTFLRGDLNHEWTLTNTNGPAVAAVYDRGCYRFRPENKVRFLRSASSVVAISVLPKIGAYSWLAFLRDCLERWD